MGFSCFSSNFSVNEKKASLTHHNRNVLKSGNTKGSYGVKIFNGSENITGTVILASICKHTGL